MAEKAKTGDVPDRKRDRKGDVDALRTTLAKIVQVVFSLFAVVLAVGVLLVAMRDNVSETNGLVKLVFHICDAIDGPFSREHGIFSFTGSGAVTKNALFNWGLAAIVYLVIGRVLARIISPKA